MRANFRQKYESEFVWIFVVLFFRYSVSGFIYREETYEVKNKGTPEEETILDGVYRFKAEDAYRYSIKYTIDKNGTKIDVSRESLQPPHHRITPNALKSLVGWIKWFQTNIIMAFTWKR